jgi:hypothetical protein
LLVWNYCKLDFETSVAIFSKFQNLGGLGLTWLLLQPLLNLSSLFL